MKKTTINCDNCQADLTYTYNCVDYRLHLDTQYKSSLGGAVTAMHIDPPISEPHHFCHLGCLKEWINK